MSYVPAGGPRLAEFLDGLPIVQRWRAGHPVVWQTGQQDGPEQESLAHHTHCSAFAAAVGLWLDVYLLRPPHHGQIQLANAQTSWLDGDTSFGGPAAEAAGWTKLGVSFGPGVLAASVRAANEGRLVLACYAASPPTPGHVAIVRPDDGDASVSSAGPTVMMAGVENFERVAMRDAFANHPGAWPGNIALFVHDTPLQVDAVG